MELFKNHHAANAYVGEITEPTERLLTEACVARAISAWLGDPAQAKALVSEPIDLLAFAKGVHAFFRNRRALEGILDGSLTTLEELSDVF
jgi:hypothetical protein